MKRMKTESATTGEESHLIDWRKVPNLLIRNEIEPYPPYEQKLFTELYMSTAVLILAVDGEKADIAGKMKGFLHFVETPFGKTLAACAGEAKERGPQTWAAFSTAIRLPGFDLVRAVISWLNARPTPSFAEYYYKRKSEGPLTEAEADFYDRGMRAEIPPGLEAFEASFRERQRLFDAEIKRKQRSKPFRKNDQYKEVIQRDWITLALWCRTTKGILRCYPWMPQADAEEQYASFKRIDDAISKLGFSSSRKPENNDKIEEAEEAMRQLITAHL